MFRRTSVNEKSPVVIKRGSGTFSKQLEHLLSRKPLHYKRWESLHMYDPRKLVHAAVAVDHFTLREKYDPHWHARVHWVPDQEWLKVPIDPVFKDAYWYREHEARTLQAPYLFEKQRDEKAKLRVETDFNDLAYAQKHMLSEADVLQNLKSRRQ